jgi:hypothetical protein
VLDTAADRDLIEGGGPGPQPRISARQAFRTMVLRLFLPAMLLDPGTSLRLLPDADPDGRRVLVVRLAARSLDPRIESHVVVVAATGEIVSVQDTGNGQATWRLEGTTACGPLHLPSAWLLETVSRASEFEFDDALWNPDLPARIESATEHLTQPRAR